jgi:hypothetical protein
MGDIAMTLKGKMEPKILVKVFLSNATKYTTVPRCRPNQVEPKPGLPIRNKHCSDASYPDFIAHPSGTFRRVESHSALPIFPPFREFSWLDEVRTKLSYLRQFLFLLGWNSNLSATEVIF